MPRLVTQDLNGALVPDDYGAAASEVAFVDALELARRYAELVNKGCALGKTSG
jgi:hypothetical protein